MTRRGLMLGAATLAGAARADPAGDWARIVPPGARAARILGEGAAFALDADAAVAFLWRPVRAQAGDMLRWRWRVDAAPPPTDPRERGSDDRPAAVHLWLDAGPGPSLFGRLAEALGYPRVTHAICWQWGGSLPAGAQVSNPYHVGGVIVVLRDAAEPLGVWRAEARDVDAELRAALGLGAAAVRGLAVSIDTDDAGGRAAARIADLVVAR